MTLSEKKTIYVHLAVVAVVAFVLRLTYFLLALDHLGVEEYFTSLPDSGAYWEVARNFYERSDIGSYWLFIVGPGYGFILAVLHKLTFGSYHILYIFNILMGTAAPVFIYLLAHELFGSKVISFSAALINAVSLTAITLSCNILTDQPAFTLLALSLLTFLVGLRKNKLSWFVASGAVGGIAAYVRGAMGIWGYILLFLTLLVVFYGSYDNKKALLKKALVAPVLIILMVQSWSFYNFVNNDVYTFGANGIRAIRFRMCAVTLMNNTGIGYDELMARWNYEDSVYFEGKQPTLADIYYNDIRNIKKIADEHPGWLVKTYLHNVENNIIEGNFIPKTQVPSLDPLWNKTISITGKWLGYLLCWLTIFGLVLMLFKKRVVPFLILSSVYVYFTLITGLTVWQGSRLHYTAELSWGMVIVFLLYNLYAAGKGYFVGKKQHK